MADLLASEVESRRFGLRFVRGVLEDLDPQALMKELWALRADVAMIRLPAEKTSQLTRLDSVGLPYLVADTLVRYHVDLERHTPRPLRNHDLLFREADESDTALLDGLVGEIFPGYTNHYATNPFLPTDDILDGYKEWTTSYLSTRASNRTVFLAERESVPVAFATLRWDDSVGEGVLFGVHPEAAGGGVYGDLIRYSQTWFRGRGLKLCSVSTQVQNMAVQNVWGREGFTMRECFVTAHVNSFFDATKRPEDIVEYTVNEEDCGAYRDASGDANPLHFDPDFARGLGYADSLAHGLVAEGVLSRYFGTVFPGPGTIFLGSTHWFARPLYRGKRYRFRFTFPVARVSGFTRALVRVEDEEGRLCMHAYCDLERKVPAA